MTCRIKWEPISKKANDFENNAQSKALGILNKAFGEIIESKDIPALRAMTIATGDALYDEIADKISVHGDIKIWGEY